jgi:hypothetical protein
MAPDKVFKHVLSTGTVTLTHVSSGRRSDGSNTRLRATFESPELTYYGKFTWAELDRQLVGSIVGINEFITKTPSASVSPDNVTLEFTAASHSLILDLWPTVAEAAHRMSQTMADMQAELDDLRARLNALASAPVGSPPKN